MQLSVFILKNLEEIAQEWEEFAVTYLTEAKSMDKDQLRDHLSEILKTIAIDLNCSQTAKEQTEKSKGLFQSPKNSNTAAAVHGASRWLSGFSLYSTVAEYRALRASVIRLWQK
jgi:RsbT co-antagonist protein rsbRD N-terminal domain